MVWTFNAKLGPMEAARAFAEDHFSPPAAIAAVETELESAHFYRGVIRLVGEPRRFKLLGRAGLWSVGLA